MMTLSIAKRLEEIEALAAVMEERCEGQEPAAIFRLIARLAQEVSLELGEIDETETKEAA